MVALACTKRARPSGVLNWLAPPRRSSARAPCAWAVQEVGDARPRKKMDSKRPRRRTDIRVLSRRGGPSEADARAWLVE